MATQSKRTSFQKGGNRTLVERTGATMEDVEKKYSLKKKDRKKKRRSQNDSEEACRNSLCK